MPKLPWWTRIVLLVFLITILWLASVLFTPRAPAAAPSDGVVRPTPDWRCVFGQC